MTPQIDLQHLDATSAMLWTWMVDFAPRLFTALIVLGIGYLVAGWMARLVSRLLQGTGSDDTVRPVAAAVVRYAIILLVFVVALSQIGIQTASLLAVLGAAGLAIGLALQGTLTNIAAGIMLLWLRPFRIGDYIEVGGSQAVAGTVREIGLFACQLQTFDGLFVFAPNSAIWNVSIRNHSRNAGRLISCTVTLPAGADIEKAKATLLAIAHADDRILKDPAPDVFLEDVTAAGLVLNCRAWAPQAKVGEVQRTMVETIRQRYAGSGEGAVQEINRLVPPETDPSRLMPAPAANGHVRH